MPGENPSQKIYAFGTFLAVSVLSGLLLAGLAFPFASILGTTAQIASDSVNDLPADLDAPPAAVRSQVLLADGTELASFFDENRVYVPLAKISKPMQQAQVAVEDQDFYQHGAISLESTLRQLIRNSRSGEITGGGSTITQQYVKLLLIQKATQAGDKDAVAKAQEQSLERKIREMRYAIAMEKKLSKDQILEGYLNLAYYGAGAYGVEAAAKRYFNTTAENLTVAQSAMLAGLVKDPSGTNPVSSPEKALNRRSFVISQMRREGYISPEQEQAALAEPFNKDLVQPLPAKCASSRYPHVCDYIERTLLSDDIASLGKTPAERRQILDYGGLTIRTSIDPKVQDAAFEAINQSIKPADPVIGLTNVLDPKTGAIIAMAQSRPVMGNNKEAGEDYMIYAAEHNKGGSNKGFFNGSTIKPIIIAAALEKGIPASRSYVSNDNLEVKGMAFQSCSGRFVQNRSWKVSNGGASYGSIDMVQATAKSVNTYFVQLIADVGICDTLQMAQRLGLELGSGAPLADETISSRPTVSLGQVNVNPLSVTQVYATLANRGVRCDTHIITSITTRDGKELEVPNGNCRKVIEPEVADTVTKLLEGPMKFGTARGFALPSEYDQAGKTGTGAKASALSFAGYTPDLAGSSMIAVIDPTDSYWHGGDPDLTNLRLPGGTLLRGFGADTGQMWRKAMLAGLEGRERSKFVEPPSHLVVGSKVRVPDVGGLSIEEAKARIEGEGFTTAVQQVFSDQPVGTFLGVSPSGSAPKGSRIALRVSKGPDPAAQPPAPPAVPVPPAIPLPPR